MRCEDERFKCRSTDGFSSLIFRAMVTLLLAQRSNATTHVCLFWPQHLHSIPWRNLKGACVRPQKPPSKLNLRFQVAAAVGVDPTPSLRVRYGRADSSRR